MSGEKQVESRAKEELKVLEGCSCQISPRNYASRGGSRHQEV